MNLGPRGIDGLSRFLGMRWDSAERVRIEVREELINPAGLLSGPVAYALADRLLATAIGSFSIFPRERLGAHERPV